MRVGIAESVPPPRLVIGFGKDRRTVDAVRVQDETVVYRYWLEGRRGGRTGPRRARARSSSKAENVARPKTVAANVSGDQRYGGDRGLHVDSMVVHGPVVVDRRPTSPIPPAHPLLHRPDYGDDSRLDCGRGVIARFAERAFRRPASTDEVDRIIEIFRLADDRGESFERAVQVALTTSWPRPSSCSWSSPTRPGERRPAADRSSSWPAGSRTSSGAACPTRRCSTRPATGRCGRTSDAQVDRMLDDPKSTRSSRTSPASGSSFGKLDGATPDPDLFPGFDDALRDAMRRGDRAVLRLHPARRPQRPGAARLRLHVPQRAAGPPLRDRGRRGRRVPQGRR